MRVQRVQSDEVREYYDANTAAFERFGQGGSEGVIRRAVWGPGVSTRSEAFRYVDRLVLSEIERLIPECPHRLRVLDLGCGLGSSLAYLAARAPIEGLGVTISGLQAARALARFAASGAADRLRCLHADFLTLPEPKTRAELALSIEAFLHSPSPHAYFEAAARQLAPGGRLLICDDFLTERTKQRLPARELDWLAELRDGWLAHSVVCLDDVVAAAQRAGFRLDGSLDLTPYLELGRPRDHAVRALCALMRPFRIAGQRWRSLIGGNALQLALRAGLVEYRYTTWTKLG